MEKKFVPHSHAPYTGSGNESFTDHSFTAYPVMNEAAPFLFTAIDDIEFEGRREKAFTLADYGTADGGTSLSLFSTLIGRVKGRFGSKQAVQVLYEDQPNADYCALFRILHGLKRGKVTSYLEEYSDVYVAACGTNFFSQCFPRQSIHVGFSATAAHWLSSRPCVLKSCISYALSDDEIERKTFARAAKKDWELFLVNRGKELVSGGYLVVANLGMDEHGQFSGHSLRVKQSIRRSFEKYWSEMVDEGIISQNEFQNTTFNSYYRTEKESAAPFQDTSSMVSQMNLQLIDVKTVLLPCPQHTSWMTSGNRDDPKAKQIYAAKFIAQTRAWSNSTFLEGLSDRRREEEKHHIVDEMFSRYQTDVANAPEEHAIDFIHVYLLIKKE